MSDEEDDDKSSGFIDNNDIKNQNMNHNDYNIENVDSPRYDSDNLIFKNDDDLIISEIHNEKIRVSYLGIFSDSQFSSIINIISSAIGGGFLNFPSILSHLGLPLTAIIFLFVSISIYYTIDLLRRFVVDTKYFSFALMTNEILGNIWLKVYAICSLIFYLSIEVNYLSIIYSLISKMIEFSGNYAFILNIIYFIITITIEIFICSYIAKIQRIHLLSLISALLFILILLLIIILGTINIIKKYENKLDYDVLISPNIINKWEYFFGIMSFIIEYVYGLSYHSSYPTLLSNLREVDEKNTKKVHVISFIFISLSYILITFFGFFLKTSMPDVLSDGKNVPNRNSFPKVTFKVFLCFFLFTVVPLRFVVIRDNYTSLIAKNRKLSFTLDLMIVSICIILCNLIVNLTNESIIKFNIVSNFMQIFGGIFGVIISFALPVINYIGANGKRKVKSIIGYILAIVFSIIGLLSVGYSIYGLLIKNDYDNE